MITDPSWENAAYLAGDVFWAFVPSATSVKLGARLLNKLDDASDIAKGAGKATDATKNRVNLRKGTVAQIKSNAPKTADGKFIDKNNGKVIEWPYDIGHKKGQEWRRRKEMHKKKCITRKEVIEAENNPNLFQIEDRSSNRSHKYENNRESYGTGIL